MTLKLSAQNKELAYAVEWKLRSSRSVKKEQLLSLMPDLGLKSLYCFYKEKKKKSLMNNELFGKVEWC